jgi:hypothetical protein
MGGSPLKPKTYTKVITINMKPETYDKLVEIATKKGYVHDTDCFKHKLKVPKIGVGKVAREIIEESLK